MRLLLVMAVFLLAGCLGLDPGRADPPGQSTPEPTPGEPEVQPGEPTVPEPVGPAAMLLDFSYRDCEGYHGVWPMPTATAQAQLPEQFVAFNNTDPFGGAKVRYTWLSCDSFDTASGIQIDDTGFGFVAVQVQDPGLPADEHWYLLRMITADEVMEQLWTAAGYDVVTGTYDGTFTGIGQAPIGGGAFTTSLAGYSASMAATIYEAGAERDTLLFTETADGLLVWSGTYHFEFIMRGAGQMTPATSDPFAAEPFDERAAGAVQYYGQGVHWLANDLWRYTDLDQALA